MASTVRYEYFLQDLEEQKRTKYKINGTVRYEYSYCTRTVQTSPINARCCQDAAAQCRKVGTVLVLVRVP